MRDSGWGALYWKEEVGVVEWRNMEQQQEEEEEEED
jgi:hypothetical protein